MVLRSNSVSLTTREPVAATWESTWSEGSKSSDREGTRAGEEERGQLEEDAVHEDKSRKLQEQLMLEQEKKRKEEAAQEEELRKQQEAEAQAQAEAEAKARAEAQAQAEAQSRKQIETQKYHVERERETSVKIYQYRRSVPIAEAGGYQGVSIAMSLFCLPSMRSLLCHPCFAQLNQPVPRSL